MMNSTSPNNATPPVARVSAAYKAAKIVVTAGSDGLVANTPVIIDDSELTDTFSLATAIVKSGTTELPTQHDEELGELVFQLPSAIAVNGSATFEVYAEETGTSNGQSASIKLGKGRYNETYGDWLPDKFSDTFTDATGKVVQPSETWWGPNSIGEVIWVETDWAIMCLHVGASWRQGSWKHVIMTDADPAKEWDAANAMYNASEGPWKWGTGLFNDVDPGWGSGATVLANDTVNFVKVGPVRAVMQMVSRVGYSGVVGEVAINASRTYSVYDGFSGIAQLFNITGAKANEAFVDFKPLNFDAELTITTQIIDGAYPTWNLVEGSNNFTKVYAPGDGVKDRVGGGNFDLTKVNDSYVGVYNESNYGFALNWGSYSYKQNVTKIDWSEEVVMAIRYSFDYFPRTGLNRLYVPFSGGAVGTGSVTDYIDSLNARWVAPYTTSVSLYEPPIYITVHVTDDVTVMVTTTVTESAPGFVFLTTILVLAAVSVIYYRKRK